jgi:phosphoglycerate kinase
MLKRPVVFLDDCVGPDVVARTEQCAPGTVFLLENLRFHIEECGDAENREGKKITADKEAVQRFREALTKLGDVFVFEAFGAAHRPHSSVVGVKLSQRVAGCLLQREMDVFSQVLERPKRPYLAMIGGAKVSDKIGVIMNMLDKVDEMIIGGGMAYTFKKVAEGVAIGKSLFDVEGSKKVQEIVSKARQRGVKLHFPVDHVVASAFKSDADKKVVTDAEGVPAEWLALDIGPASQALFAQAMARAQTIVWNGPLGKFEWPAFADGTRSAMHNMVLATRRGATTVIGGGDTGAAAWQFELDGKPVGAQVTHVSTGGGSTLVLLEGMMLPGIDVLSEKAHLPPPWASLKDVYLQLQLLRQDNAQLREELRSLKKRVEPVLPPEKKDKEKKDK